MLRNLSSRSGFSWLSWTKPQCFVVLRNHSEVARDQEETPNAQKLIKVAIIGVPNAGKSTFINKIVNHRICPTSSKVHTTRAASRAITVQKGAQMIFFDTPGLVTSREMKKHHLDTSFTSGYRHSIQHSNMIGVIHDVSSHWTRGQLHGTVLETLELYKTLPSFLVLNKIDCLRSKRVLLELVDNLTMNSIEGVLRKGAKVSATEPGRPAGWPNFSRVFMVSSVTGNGLQDVQNFLLSRATHSPWEFSEDVHTDQPSESLIEDAVRARLLDFMPQEIPYSLESQLEYFSSVRGILYASVQVTCPNPRIERLVCGEADGKLKQITERVSSDLVEAFRMPISLTITTTSRKRE
ncbi:GTPase Era, mitochondrial-like isoform X2 [Phlebotomus argentipes]|uniref:GTPase Era, mitochondrial-like isoform X2 n=1 Tax=Phlebotomus argentipes TaxID=94469 RepID=UPI002892E411|nr:GTPase Era, mitochondrial-like isoform X2 [Phlebotomus argentipes]